MSLCKRAALHIGAANGQIELFGPPTRVPASSRSQSKKASSLSSHSAAAPAAVPWRCVVLAVDTAKRSGWAMRFAGKLRASGATPADDATELDAILAYALDYATKQGVKCALVLERAWGRNTSVLVSLGMARGHWLAAWKRAHQPATRVVSVYPVTWRAKVLGKGGTRRIAANGGGESKADRRRPSWEAIRARRAEQERLEVAAASGELRGACELGPDESAAILISRWGAHAVEVGEVLGLRKAKGKA